MKRKVLRYSNRQKQGFKMRTLLSYPTNIGIFDVGQSEDKKYHIIFDDESLGAFDSIQEAVDQLINNQTSPIFHQDSKEKIDTSNLGIPKDYTQWDSAY